MVFSLGGFLESLMLPNLHGTVFGYYSVLSRPCEANMMLIKNISDFGHQGLMWILRIFHYYDVADAEWPLHKLHLTVGLVNLSLRSNRASFIVTHRNIWNSNVKLIVKCLVGCGFWGSSLAIPAMFKLALTQVSCVEMLTHVLIKVAGINPLDVRLVHCSLHLAVRNLTISSHVLALNLCRYIVLYLAWLNSWVSSTESLIFLFGVGVSIGIV